MADEGAAASTLWTPEIWTGTWRWIPEKANFADTNRHTKAQTSVVRVEGDRMNFNMRMELLDGSKMSWTWDGVLNGPIKAVTWDHDGSEMLDIAFYFMGDLGGDTYTTKDGTKAGSEYFHLTPDTLDVWGCYTLNKTTQFPYYEQWERVA